MSRNSIKITKRFINKWKPCQEAVDWFYAQDERDSLAIIKKLIKEDRLWWASWLVARLLDRNGRIKYAVYAAKRALPLFESAYPGDKRPREAINAAMAVLRNDTSKTRSAAKSAGRSAVWSAGPVAESAGYVAESAEYAAASAECAAESFRRGRGPVEMRKILKYGIKLLMEQEKHGA